MSAADLVLTGGRVYTGDGFATSVAIAGERVVAVGGDDVARELVGPRTRVVSLAKRVALPGLHDAHTHLLGGALSEDQLDLRDARVDEDLARAVAARIAERGEGEWVLGRGWDSDLFPGGRWPSRAALDAVSPRTPVLLRRRDGHAALANAVALAKAGATRDTPDPPGGKLLRAPDGATPDGILLEDPALELVTRLLTTPSRAAQARAADRLLRRCASLGITALQDDPSFDEGLAPIETYAELHARGALTARVHVWRRIDRALDLLDQDERRLASLAAASPGLGSRLGFSLLKGYLDGSLGSRTALLFEPYCDDPGVGTGVPILGPARLTELVLRAQRSGRQVGLHAIGDRAIAEALDAIEAVARTEGLEAVRARRHRVEHAQVFREADVARLARLGAVASVQPVHLASDVRVAEARLGSGRCDHAYPWRELLEHGALVAFGTDYPVEPLDPLPGLYCAVTHGSPREPGRAPLRPGQAIDLAAAVTAATAGSARATHREHELGRLAPGYLADVTVLSLDPFDRPPQALLDASCAMTIVGGRVVYEGEGQE